MLRWDGKKTSCEARDRGFESSHDCACAFTRASRKVYSFSGWVVPLVATVLNGSLFSTGPAVPVGATSTNQAIRPVLIGVFLVVVCGYR